MEVAGLICGAHGKGIAVALAGQQHASRLQLCDRCGIIRRRIMLQHMRAGCCAQPFCAQRILHSYVDVVQAKTPDKEMQTSCRS